MFVVFPNAKVVAIDIFRSNLEWCTYFIVVLVVSNTEIAWSCCNGFFKSLGFSEKQRGGGGGACWST